jgi:AraC-like DNA-binding protein
VSADLVPVPSVVLERLASLGVDVARVLRHADVLPSRFQPSRAKLTVPEFFRLWRALEAVGGGRDLGLRIGKETLPHQLDIASLAALHSPNLGEALKKFARYKRLVCGEQVSIETNSKEARIRFHWVHVEEELPQMLVDATFSSLVALAGHGVGAPVVPLRVELARWRRDERILRQHYGCPIRFDAPLDLLVLEEKALARPFITHNADLLAMLLPALETALEQTVMSRSIAEDVRAVLSRRISGERPSVEKVAEEMHMSPRTLQRRLGELGITYQGLLDDVRHDASRRLLANTDLDAGEVAFLVGFEELNSFTRAFHGWEGVTPSRWREALRVSPRARAG